MFEEVKYLFNRVKEVFTKEYKDYTEYLEFQKRMVSKIKLNETEENNTAGEQSNKQESVSDTEVATNKQTTDSNDEQLVKEDITKINQEWLQMAKSKLKIVVLSNGYWQNTKEVSKEYWY